MTDAAPSQVPQALVHRVIDRTTPPPGEIITPDMAHHAVDWTPASGGEPGTPGPTNMAHQPDRIDHWDAYVCRFDGDEGAASDQPTP